MERNSAAFATGSITFFICGHNRRPIKQAKSNEARGWQRYPDHFHATPLLPRHQQGGSEHGDVDLWDETFLRKSHREPRDTLTAEGPAPMLLTMARSSALLVTLSANVWITCERGARISEPPGHQVTP